MQIYSERKLSVVIVATDNEHRALLQVLVDGTSVAPSVHACENFPVAGDDPHVRSWLASGGFVTSNPDVILVDIPVDNSQFALRAIELLHQEVPKSAIFAVGSGSQPEVVLNAMFVGVRGFIERPTTTAGQLDAIDRLTHTSQGKVATGMKRTKKRTNGAGSIFHFLGLRYVNSNDDYRATACCSFAITCAPLSLCRGRFVR